MQRTLKTPLGLMKATLHQREFHSLEFDSSFKNDSDPLFDLLEKELALFFVKKLKTFSVPIAQEGTAFQTKIWDELQKIPYGETLSYSSLATRIGHPKAARAVGNTMASNRLLILVPCHRVICANGSLGGYRAGAFLKQKLLEWELG